MLFYKPSLQRIGMTVNVRMVDSAQYENRLRQWDFDIITATWGESLSPGNEQRGYWGSAAADHPGSRNLVGIKNPAVDKLIDRVIYAKDREELVAATHALDRVLLWNFYVVPQWTYGKQRTARWDRFGQPQNMPKYGLAAFPTIWWWDKEKAAKVPRRSYGQSNGRFTLSRSGAALTGRAKRGRSTPRGGYGARNSDRSAVPPHRSTPRSGALRHESLGQAGSMG